MTRRSAAARETHTKYPRWYGSYEIKRVGKPTGLVSDGWHAMSYHPLYQLTVKSFNDREFWQDSTPTEEFAEWPEYLDECRRRVPAVWLDKRWGKYNFLRFVEKYLPPRPPHHYLRATLTSASFVIYWGFHPYGTKDPGWARLMREQPFRLDYDEAARYLTDVYGRMESDSIESLPLGWFDSNSVRHRSWIRSLADPREVGFDLPPGPPERYVRAPGSTPSRHFWELNDFSYDDRVLAEDAWSVWSLDQTEGKSEEVTLPEARHAKDSISRFLSQLRE